MADRTMLKDLVVPEVMADMINAKLPHLIQFSELAEIDTTLQGRPGDKITTPKYAFIGAAEDVAEGAAIPISKLDTSTADVTIKKAGRGVKITDEAILSGYGDPLGEATNQLGMAIALKIDNDSVGALNGIIPAMTVDKGTEGLSKEIVAKALVKFGEKIDEPCVIFVTPDQYAELRLMKEFLDLKDIAGKPILMSGVVGEIFGCQIKVSANPAMIKGGKVNNFIVKPGALRILLKRDTLVETDRNIETKVTVITADKHYGVSIKDDTKAIKLILAEKPKPTPAS